MSGLGVLLFVAGSLGGLSLSAAVLWGEVEARVYSSYSGDRNLQLECPLMISPAESGIVRTEIMNLTDKEIKPVVNAEISQANAARRESQTFILAPGENGKGQWLVTSSDAIFNNLILVNILQSQYSNNPSHWGSCGILLFSLFGLTGMQTFYLLFGGGIMGLLVGGGLWAYVRWPLGQFDLNIAQAGILLAGITTAALISSLLRWWGLILFLDAVSLLVIGVIVVEFILFPKKES